MMDAIIVEDLHRSYGKINALDGLSLRVSEGTVHALLGPNGAGKTTLVRILATLLRPDAGRAVVCGFDVTSAPQRVREVISLTGQSVATDNALTGRENLELIGRLRRLKREAARRRAAELLVEFELEDVADRQVRTYSGGLQRRLDLAMSLVTSPRVLFLDEPTINLDPGSRHTIWAYVERISRIDGTTVVLTTQYLEEADRLADQLSVVDHGKVIAGGTPAELKARSSGDHLEVTVGSGSSLQRAEEVLRRHSNGEVKIDTVGLHLVAPVVDHVGVLPRLVRDFDEAGVSVADLAVRRPTLDDAFLALTGRTADDQRSQPVRPTARWG